MDWMKLLSVVMWIIDKVMKDSDKDGRPDIFDSEPENPEVK